MAGLRAGASGDDPGPAVVYGSAVRATERACWRLVHDWRIPGTSLGTIARGELSTSGRERGRGPHRAWTAMWCLGRSPGSSDGLKPPTISMSARLPARTTNRIYQLTTRSEEHTSELQ